ncbi:hypothetical protein EYF80_026420 [Liparis tanakae]|uniref:Uncharacterized protein n=1 Tax=Liparis tanakae TaxID=230148 RepID=A0A4Z2HBS6_9TELE|nr:hypothetical protein EYF80_026420 [Liparis tanakae]
MEMGQWDISRKAIKREVRNKSCASKRSGLDRQTVCTTPPPTPRQLNVPSIAISGLGWRRAVGSCEHSQGIRVVRVESAEPQERLPRLRQRCLRRLLLVVAGEPPGAGRNINRLLGRKVGLVDRKVPPSPSRDAGSSIVAQVGVSLFIKTLPAPHALKPSLQKFFFLSPSLSQRLIQPSLLATQRGQLFGLTLNAGTLKEKRRMSSDEDHEDIIIDHRMLRWDRQVLLQLVKTPTYGSFSVLSLCCSRART